MKIFKKRPLTLAIFSALAAYAPMMVNAQTDSDQMVVTAQKVSQSALKVGASLSAVSSDDIREKGITDAKSLSDLMPNTQISQQGGSSVVINIRGVENTNTSALGEPAAAFHIDGVYMGRPQAAGAAFYDIERVEVLRGPQGTLYGRNANAGVINVITKSPSNKLEGYTSLDLGTLGQKRLDAAINLPVNEALALRASVSGNQRDGFSETKTGTNGFAKNRDDIDSQSVRLQAAVKFSPDTSINLSYDQSANKTTGPNYYDLTTGGIPSKLVDTSNSLEGKFNDKASGFKAEFKTDVGFANLNYIYGHRSLKIDQDYSLGMLGLLAHMETEQDSHELRLSSKNNSPLQWVGGVYKFKEKSKNGRLDVVLPSPPMPPVLGSADCGGMAACAGLFQFLDHSITSDSQAIFGQATYSLNDTTRLVAGARYTEDEKSRNGDQLLSNSGNFSASNPANLVLPLYASGKWSKATYKVGFEKDLSPTQLLYGTIATGYKSGGFNDGDQRTNPNLVFQPEQITSYEMGLNGKYLDNALQLTSSVFHYNYNQMQKSGIVNNQMFTINTGKASVNGLELGARYRVSKSGVLNATAGLLSAKYDSYTTPNGTDYKDKSLDKSPSITLNLGYTHNWDLSTGGRLTAYVGARYSASYVLTDFGTPKSAPVEFKQGSYTKTDISLTYANEKDDINVQIYAKNIENKSQLKGISTLGATNYGYMSEPRTVGIRATFKF
jgi:iron complex outermembrane recepter protein